MMNFNTKDNDLLSSLNTFNKMTADLCQRITKQQLELVGENMTRLSKQMQRLSHITKPEDFLKAQSEIINENLSAAVKHTQTLMEASLGNIDELTNLCEKSTSSNLNTLKTKTKKSKKSTKGSK